jgi:hypothetical protein
MPILERGGRTHPVTTYLVPPAEAGRLRAQLKDGSFTVHSEAHVTGWYEASEKELFPTHWRLFHDMMKVIFFFPALVVSVVTTLIAGKLLPWIGGAARLIAHNGNSGCSARRMCEPALSPPRTRGTRRSGQSRKGESSGAKLGTGSEHERGARDRQK